LKCNYVKKIDLPHLEIFFSFKSSTLYLKSLLGVVSLKLPASYFYKVTSNEIVFHFINKFFLRSFFSHLLRSCLYLFHLYFVRLRIKGLGYKIKKIASSLYVFFFGSINFFYFHVPSSVLVKTKKRRIIMLSNDLVTLKTLLAHLLLLKKLNVYRTRGLVYPKQIITLKIGKKNL